MTNKSAKAKLLEGFLKENHVFYKQDLLMGMIIMLKNNDSHDDKIKGDMLSRDLRCCKIFYF